MTKERRKMLDLLIGVGFGLDFVAKRYVVDLIPLYTEVPIIPNFLSLTYTKNYGAAWSMFSGSTYILLFIGLIAVIAIYNICIKNKELEYKDIVLYGLLLGGISSNMIDRAFLGYVIDYISIKIFGYYFPVFNIADMLIVGCSICIIFKLIRGGENEHNN